MATGKKSGQEVTGYATHDSSAHLVPFSFSRRATGPDDVTFKVLYCGICHSDLHQLRNEWGGESIYPMVPGHEVVGIVTEVGENVKKFKVGDKAGVGCMVNSCRRCVCCGKSEEQYCDEVIWTYNALDRDGSPTFGGYSSLMVIDQKYVLRIPDNLPLDAAAPLLCAGISVYSPMKHFGMMEKGKHLGVVGLGGLGHMAVKFAKKMGFVVTLISTSPHKEKEAREVFGVDNFLLSTDLGQMAAAAKSLDFILDSVSVTHPLLPLLDLLKVNGGLVLIGLPDKPIELIAPSIVLKRRFVAGSCIGGIEETQEMLDFCGKNNIVCTIEKIPMDYVNTAMERLEKGDVKYRFVLDIGATLASPSLNGA